MSLRARFWGTRGSVPSPGPGTARYGGNTPCVEVRTPEGRLIVLDAGTGFRLLGKSLSDGGAGGIEADIFLSHLHWDHILGIPFFAPLFAPGNKFRIWGWKGMEAELERVIQDLMAPAVFPVRFGDVPAQIEFQDVEVGERYDVGCQVSAFPVHHPGGALGYRLEGGGDANGAIVYISDNELCGKAGSGGVGAGWRDEVVRQVRGARVLVHDATYSDEEYDSYRGWGHSTWQQAADLALECGVEKLVLFHHLPDRRDDEIDRMVEGCSELIVRRGGSVSVCAAAEGMELIV